MKLLCRHIAILGSLALCMVFFAAGADTLGELQARFDRETNSGHKAKLLEKLGDAQFNETRRSGTAGDYNAVGLILEKYRDNVRGAFNSLKKDHPDAERHYNGYRQVEISVRKGIHEVDEILLIAPDEFKPPISLVRRDLAAIQDELIAMLFPPRHKPQARSPETSPPPAVPSTPPIIPSTPPSEKQP